MIFLEEIKIKRSFSRKVKSKKKLFLLILFILITILIVIFLISKSFEHKTQIAFFEFYLEENYRLEENTLNKFIGVFNLLYEEFDYIMEFISPIEMLAIGIVETNFQNVKGDSGESLGYFQIQAPTYWYLKHHYLELYETIDFTLAWYWDNVKVRPDAQLMSAILYLYDLKIRYGEEQAYSLYNGGSQVYQDKIIKQINKLEQEYDEFKRR